MNKTEIELLIAEQLPDNQERLISAQRLRQLLTTLSNSGFNLETDYTLLAHSTDRQYSVGQIVEYNNKLYKCLIANTGAYEQANWVELNQGSLIPTGPAGGDLSGIYPNPAIGANKITYAKFQQLPAYTVFGNNTASSANGGAVPTENLSDLANSMAYVSINSLGRWLQGTLFKAWGGRVNIADGDSAFGGTDFMSHNTSLPNTSGWIPAAAVKLGLRLRIVLAMHSGENTSTANFKINGTNILTAVGLNAGQTILEIVATVTAVGAGGQVLGVWLRSPSASTNYASVAVDLSTGMNIDVTFTQPSSNTLTVSYSQIELL